MKGRRSFLQSILGLLLAVPAARLAAAGPIPDAGGSLAAGLAAGAGMDRAAGLAARRHGAYFLLDGWVLTARDLEALGAEVVG